jgi:hypothetical protein
MPVLRARLRQADAGGGIQPLLMKGSYVSRPRSAALNLKRPLGNPDL